MRLAYQLYASTADKGTFRVGSSFKNVHAIVHDPMGDD